MSIKDDTSGVSQEVKEKILAEWKKRGGVPPRLPSSPIIGLNQLARELFPVQPMPEASALLYYKPEDDGPKKE